MFNFLVAAAPDLDAVQAYFESIPNFVAAFFVFGGFSIGVFFAWICGCIDEISYFFKLRRLKKRLDKSSQELCDYVDKYIERKESEGE